MVFTLLSVFFECVPDPLGVSGTGKGETIAVVTSHTEICLSACTNACLKSLPLLKKLPIMNKNVQACKVVAKNTYMICCAILKSENYEIHIPAFMKLFLSSKFFPQFFLLAVQSVYLKVQHQIML